MKRELLGFLLLTLILCSFRSYSQNQSNSQKIQQLPLGHQLRSALDGLPPQAKARAQNWLNELTVPQEDFNSLRIDKHGGVFYADSFPSHASGADSSSSEPPISMAAPSISEVFTLHSKPGAPYVVHLDFDGMDITGRRWNDNSGVATYAARPYDSDGDESSFSEAERSHITSVWQRVSDDFAPFNIDVTTEEPPSYGPHVGHVLITKNVDKNNIQPITAFSACGYNYLLFATYNKSG